jgi:hypothetical protein
VTKVTDVWLYFSFLEKKKDTLLKSTLFFAIERSEKCHFAVTFVTLQGLRCHAAVTFITLAGKSSCPYTIAGWNDGCLRCLLAEMPMKNCNLASLLVEMVTRKCVFCVSR